MENRSTDVEGHRQDATEALRELVQWLDGGGYSPHVEQGKSDRHAPTFHLPAAIYDKIHHDDGSPRTYVRAW